MAQFCVKSRVKKTFDSKAMKVFSGVTLWGAIAYPLKHVVEKKIWSVYQFGVENVARSTPEELIQAHMHETALALIEKSPPSKLWPKYRLTKEEKKAGTKEL